MKHSSPAQYDNLSPADAILLQKQLRLRIELKALSRPIQLIGGADISFNRFEDTVYAGIVILTYPEMIPVETVTVVTQTKFPYISGLLAFREIPALLKVWEQLQHPPDLMVLDGQGMAHQRRMGIATHFGLLTHTPSIGCAKSRLTGTYQEPGPEPFAEQPLWDKAEQIGVVLRSKLRCKPLFISPGHLITMEQSVEVIKNSIRKYRLPEPTRLAHHLVNETRITATSALPPTGPS